jgi:hypothetical protein
MEVQQLSTYLLSSMTTIINVSCNRTFTVPIHVSRTYKRLQYTKRPLSLWVWNEVLAKLLTTHLLRNSLCLWAMFRMALTLNLILSQLNPVSNFTLYFFKAHFNIILSSTPVPPKWTSPIRLAVLLDVILVSPLRTICSVHRIHLDVIVISLSPNLLEYTLNIEKYALEFRSFSFL